MRRSSVVAEKRRHNSARVVTSGSPVKESEQDWTHEFDHLVWCEWCQNRRSIKHRDTHALEAGAGPVESLKPWQDACACGKGKHKHSDMCRGCRNASRL